MTVKEAIQHRRAYRSLEAADIDEVTLHSLAESAGLAPSCFNNQPWRYVFITDKAVLKEVFGALNKGNEWATRASLVIAVFSEKTLDCVIRDREYYLFDTGMSVGFILLRATELGLVAHPIAGYDPEKTAKILRIPDSMRVMALIIVGKHSSTIQPELNENQLAVENDRPPRKNPVEYVFRNRYSG